LIAGWSRTLPAAAQEVLVECFCKIEAPQESLISYAGPIAIAPVVSTSRQSR